MSDLFFSFSPLILGAFALWTVAMVLLMGLDLHRMRQSGQRFAWRERPLLWFAVCGISLGLSLVSPALVEGRLSNLLDGIIIFLPLILFMLSLTGGLILILRPIYQKSFNIKAPSKQLEISDLTLVAKSRLTENQTVLMMIGTGMFLGILVLLDIISFYTRLTQGQFILGEGVVLLVFLLLWLGKWLVQRRPIKRLNQWRMMLAVKGREVVKSQPIPRETMQLLSSSLVLRLKWPIIAGYLVLFLVVFLLFWLSLINFANSFTTIYYLYLLPLNLLFKLLFGLREQVEATTHGLVVVHGTKLAQQTRRMPWQEARLFTCYTMHDFLGNKTMMIYELASPDQVVQWTRVIDARPLFTPWRTELSADEYSQRMQDLCACITARTGLELYDVSEERLNAREQEMMITSQSQTNI